MMEILLIVLGINQWALFLPPGQWLFSLSVQNGHKKLGFVTKFLYPLYSVSPYVQISSHTFRERLLIGSYPVLIINYCSCCSLGEGKVC